MKKRIVLFSILLMLLTAFAAFAEEASPQSVTLTYGGKALAAKKEAALSDKDYKTYFTIKSKKALVMESETPLCALYIQVYDQPRKYEVQTQQEGQWQTVFSSAEHLSDWVPLPQGASSVRIVNKDKNNLWLAEVTAFGAGEKPAAIPTWQDLSKCDLMLMVAHPDDDLLWFGGLLPTYAGERGLNVQVVYLVPTGGERKLELLDALWHCGVEAYPAFLNMRDNRAANMKAMYQRWGESKVLNRVTGAIRQYQPEVLVTQGEKGEYGHAAHQVIADACKRCIVYAAESKRFETSLKAYGPWQVKKLYLHEYPQNPVVLDWHQPLNAFDGKDAFTVASEAMNMHASQVKRGWQLEDHGEHDNTLFGLYFSTVGEDTGNDLMEHIDMD